MQKNCEGMVDK